MTNKEFFIQCWNNEVPNTVGLIKSLPADKLDYKPNEKSRTARELVSHLVGHNHGIAELAKDGKVTVEDVPFSNLDDMVSQFEKLNGSAADKLKTMSDKDWDEKKIPLIMGGQNVWEAPAGQMCWAFLFDRIHHRGQLSTYIRPMGGKNPSIYGPSADTMPGG